MSSGISFRLYIILSKSCISRLVFTDLNRIAASYPMLNPVTQSRLFLICFPQLLLANRLDAHFISSFETILITCLFQHRLKCCNMFLCFYATIFCVAPFQEPQSLVYCCNSVPRDLPGSRLGGIPRLLQIEGHGDFSTEEIRLTDANGIHSCFPLLCIIQRVAYPQ